jgi:hypothetical protein
VSSVHSRFKSQIARLKRPSKFPACQKADELRSQTAVDYQSLFSYPARLAARKPERGVGDIGRQPGFTTFCSSFSAEADKRLADDATCEPTSCASSSFGAAKMSYTLTLPRSVGMGDSRSRYRTGIG